MKNPLLHTVGLLLAALFWLTFTGCENMGLLTGTVTFSGKPCQTTPAQTPPCSGPYANYKVEVYKSTDPNLVVATTVTGAKGEFTLPLEAGDYVIVAQHGETPDAVREYPFTIQKKQQATLEIVVSTGIQ